MKKYITFVGTGSCVLNQLYIGDWEVIGAGSLVTKNFPDAVVAFDALAKKIRKNENNDFAKY